MELLSLKNLKIPLYINFSTIKYFQDWMTMRLDGN